MAGIFKKQAFQYEHTEIKLTTYLDKYAGEDSEWELRSKVRADTMLRARQGLPVKKTVHLRREKIIEVTHRHMELVLLSLNQRKAFNELSRDIILCADSMPDGFNSGDVALKLFGPSDKPYEKGAKEQNVKMKIRRLEYNNCLLLNKGKYYHLPVWKPFIEQIEKADKTGRFGRAMQW